MAKRYRVSVVDGAFVRVTAGKLVGPFEGECNRFKPVVLGSTDELPTHLRNAVAALDMVGGKRIPDLGYMVTGWIPDDELGRPTAPPWLGYLEDRVYGDRYVIILSGSAATATTKALKKMQKERVNEYQDACSPA